MITINKKLILSTLFVTLIYLASSFAALGVEGITKFSVEDYDSVIDNLSHYGSAVTDVGDADGNGVNDILVGYIVPDVDILDYYHTYYQLLYLDENGEVINYEESVEIGQITAYLPSYPEDYGMYFTNSESDPSMVIMNQYKPGIDYLSIKNFIGGIVSEEHILPMATEAEVGQFGYSASFVGDVDNNGVEDVLIGDPYAVMGKDSPGAGGFIIYYLASDYTVVAENYIDPISAPDMMLGSSMAYIQDGMVAVGAEEYFEDYPEAGAVLIYNATDLMQEPLVIYTGANGFEEDLKSYSFGSSITNIGDIDGNGINDLAVGGYKDDDAGLDKGAIWLILLGQNYEVIDSYKILDYEGVLGLVPGEGFGYSIANIGDIDNNGMTDLVVGMPFSDNGKGQVAIVRLSNHMFATKVPDYEKADLRGDFTGDCVMDDSDLDLMQLLLELRNDNDLVGCGNAGEEYCSFYGVYAICKDGQFFDIYNYGYSSELKCSR